LVDDGVARRPFPLPDALDELIPSERISGKPLGHQLFFDDVLCGDPGMIRSRKPERVPSLHAAPPDQDVLQGMIQGVADVKRSRDIRRGDDNAIGVT
jgi:hypothetical protein